MFPETLLERVSTRLAGLDATDWQLDGNAGATFAHAWHEAVAPFSPQDEPDSTRHLAFAVVLPVARRFGQEVPDTGDDVRSATEIEVVFEYVMRPDHQVLDYRTSHAAARQVVSAINDEGSWTDGASVEVVPGVLSRSSITTDGGAVRMSCTFLIFHEYGV